MDSMQLVLLTIAVLLISNAAEQDVFNCHSQDNIECKCERRGTHQIVLLNCTREGGWSTWSEWSRCGSRSRQRRRRRCDSPTPIGKYCSGTHAQSRRCNHTKSKLPDSTSGAGANLPEFMWGSWSGWNEWGVCSCPAYQRHRTRYCVGWECSGCGVEYGPCERRCVTERWWSDWSEWINGPSKVRHRSWCSLGVDGRSLVTVLVNDTLPGATAYESTWSEWELRPGVAFRYRLPMNLLHSANDSVDIQHQLIAYNSATQVSLAFCLYLSITTMISGFVAQCLISRMFATCRRTKHRY